MNILTALFLFLAAVSLFLPVPRIGTNYLCVKAHIGDRMFNKRMMFLDVPRIGDEIKVGDFAHCINRVQWAKDEPIVILQEQVTQDAEELIAAGFVELK